MDAKDLKLLVKEKYSEIVSQNKVQSANACCGSSACCGELKFSMIGDEYKDIEGYHPDADLGLGCGMPTEFAEIKTGNQVLDLGSCAGNDCFVVRNIVGEKGAVTGIDFTETMIEKAHKNLEKTKFKNINFVKGDIENMPFDDNTFDVVISNCVLNLVPDKPKAYNEIYRVLKNGGHFCISDVVLSGKLPKNLKEAAEMYAGCVSGALVKEEYIAIIHQQNFKNVDIKKEKEIKISDNILLNYITPDELKSFKRKKVGIYSITINGGKLE